MVDDVVERLRYPMWSHTVNATKLDTETTQRDMKDAAAEIDRLRADAVRRIEETDRVLVANGRLRAELASRQIDVETFLEGNRKLRAELAAMTERAEKAEDTIGDQTDLEKDLADCRAELAAKDARFAELEKRPSEEDVAQLMWQQQTTVAVFIAEKEARIAELETYHTNCTDYINQLLGNMADDDKERVAILARAEHAEARVAELEATVLHWTSEVTRLEQNCDDDQDRAERAEDALKEQLQWKKSYTERAERAEAEAERLNNDITAKAHNMRYMDDRFRRAEAERDDMAAVIKEMREAAKKALHEMCNTVAPRTSFTDAVDELDAALNPSTRQGREGK